MTICAYDNMKSLRKVPDIPSTSSLLYSVVFGVLCRWGVLGVCGWYLVDVKVGWDIDGLCGLGMVVGVCGWYLVDVKVGWDIGGQ